MQLCKAQRHIGTYVCWLLGLEWLGSFVDIVAAQCGSMWHYLSRLMASIGSMPRSAPRIDRQSIGPGYWQKPGSLSQLNQDRCPVQTNRDRYETSVPVLK